MGRWYIPLTAALKPPACTEIWDVGIDEWLYKIHQHNGREATLARILLVKEVLDDPLRIIQGWSRPDKEDSYVYVGKPKSDYRSATIQTPAPPNKLFLVFILPSGTIDLWTWRNCSEDDADVPEDVKGTTIWPQLTTT